VYLVGEAGVHPWNSGQNIGQEGFVELSLIGRRHPWVVWLCLYLAALTLSPNYASDKKNEKLPVAPKKDEKLAVVQEKNAKPPVIQLLDPVPHERYANDIGRFLAGLPVQSGSPLANLLEKPAWIAHQRGFDSAWTKIEDERLPVMSSFQKTELAGYPGAASPVFYPFSGPDSLTVTVFFPRSPVYVMVGLEPVGTLLSPEQLEGKNLDTYLAATRGTMATILDRTFFVTHQMDLQFRGQVTDGLCLPIMELLVRSHHTILGLRYVRLNDSGEIVERAPNYRGSGQNWNTGTEIEFLDDNDQSNHKLFYFSVNLADDHLKENRSFLSFLARLQGATTFLKATSYLIHQPSFSIIRGHVLQESGAVLQDDSGVPYHFYLTSNWQVQLYGEYDRPYGPFRYMQQADLRAAYLIQKPRPLPFRIGYGSRYIPSHLLFATRMK
jgi:hypothetical protein